LVDIYDKRYVEHTNIIDRKQLLAKWTYRFWRTAIAVLQLSVSP